MKNCEQFRELIEAYALGALDADERAALDAHLASGCIDCAKATEEARLLVSHLAYLAPDAAPSSALKDRLMQTVRGEARASRRSLPPFGGVATWRWLGVAALVVLAIYSGWDAWRLRIEIREANSRAARAIQDRQDLQEQLAMAQREASILTDTTSVKIALTSQMPQTPQLEAKWHSELGIVVTGQKVPLPSGNRVLQLWLIPKTLGAKPVPSLTLRPDPDGRFVLLVSNPPKAILETKALAITEEPPGGSPQPTSAPRWVGGIS